MVAIKLMKMNGSFIVDTNIVVPYMKGDLEVIKKFNDAEQIYVTATTVGELYYGYYNSHKVSRNIKTLERFLDDIIVLKCDVKTANYYGQVRLFLKKKGRPIPQNDIWIAATAIQYHLPLVTRDKHFSFIEGLQVEKW